MPLLTAPYGTWASPISPARLAAASIDLGDLRAAGSDLFWIETRPEQGGAQVVMTAEGGSPGTVRQLSPPGFNVRTRAHEYGGAPFLAREGALVFVSFADQRLYQQAGEAAPRPITPQGFRWADLAAAPGGAIVGVREDHTAAGEPKNVIAALHAEGGSGTALWAGADFVAYPRPSPDSRRLAWMAWDYPNMPWDDASLYVADLDGAALSDVRRIAGGPGESAMEPQWSAAGELFFMSDRSGFWNLYAWREGETRPVFSRPADFAAPLWQFGQANYVLLDGAEVLLRWKEGSGQVVAVASPAGEVRRLPLPFSLFAGVCRLGGGRVAMIAASDHETPAVIVLDPSTGAHDIVRRPSPAELEPAAVARPRSLAYPGFDGAETHLLYYPPTNPAFAAPAGDKPPLIIQAHGGPTGQASPALRLAVQFWTSRGFAFADVDYGGSAGYGRAYRKRLEGRWGIVDVADVVAAARFLREAGLADPARIAIRGGSAGGFTVLAALSQSDVFAAGACYYGVADLGLLARHTHKFESRYLDGLIGPWPEARPIYEERSPINHLDGFATPLILFQGADDPVVPPEQSRMIRDALLARGARVEYLEFEGESHGFRRAETLIACAEAELSFYGQVFGLGPATG